MRGSPLTADVALPVSLLVSLLLLAAGTADAQSIVFVDSSATGSNNGSSWADAFVHLQDALAVTVPGDEVWIARGTYLPDQGSGVVAGDQDTSFVLQPGVHLLGGFAGIETSTSGRDWVQNPVVLSGDLLGNDSGEVSGSAPTRTDNSGHVLLATAETASEPFVLDGIMVRSGHAAGNLGSGAGLYLMKDGPGVVIRNSTFQYNFARVCGGAIGGQGTLVVEASVFEFNKSDGECFAGSGGAVSLSREDGADTGEVIIYDSSFRENEAQWCGGAVSFRRIPVTIANSSFVGNRAVGGGAACVSQVRDPARVVIVNAAIAANVATDEGAGAINIENSDVLIHNSVIHGNEVSPTADYPTGGAILCYEGVSNVEIRSTTFSLNTAPELSVIAGTASCRTDISNSIIWNNPSASGQSLGAFAPSAHIDVAFSIVDGDVGPGVQLFEGTFTADPVFRDLDGPNGVLGDFDDDLRLASTSPAIDAGSIHRIPSDFADLDGDGDFFEPLPFDLDGNDRILKGSSTSKLVDLGAYENTDFVTGIEDGEVPESTCSVNVYPNPAASFVHVGVRDLRSSGATVRVVDVLGRQRILATTSSGDHGARTLRVPLEDLPQGHYVLTLQHLERGLSCSTSFAVVR